MSQTLFGGFAMNNQDNLLQCERSRCKYPFYIQIEEKFICWFHYLKQIPNKNQKRGKKTNGKVKNNSSKS